MVQKSFFQFRYSLLVLSYIFSVLSYLGKTLPVSFIHGLWDFRPFKFSVQWLILNVLAIEDTHWPVCHWCYHSPGLLQVLCYFFFIEVSILGQKSKKLSGLKKCDWMRPFPLKGECEQSEVQEASLVWIEDSGWVEQLWAMPPGKGEVWVQVGKRHMLASTGEWTACF